MNQGKNTNRTKPERKHSNEGMLEWNKKRKKRWL